jgi:RNA polymerase sigma factor (sigma-70 family)
VATGGDDERLVAAVREGDDRAFEALYERYHARVGAYVLGMVKDHGRAEDVTQEVFVSALRRMRQTERPIAFRPWIYEIAKNACIDAYRRSSRAEEVSFDAERELFAGSGPAPDAAVDAKQQLDHLCGAFGGLSDTHHEILLLRELEGMSYREIGERMGMSRAGVESTLFRARKRLTEEYDELTTGAGCRRVRGLIATAVAEHLGARDVRRLARHAHHCSPCRREAIAAGIDASLLTYVPLRRRAADKIASLLPFLRGRGGGELASSASMLSDHAGAGWAKAVALVAVLVAGAGTTGVGPSIGGGGDGAAEARDRPESGRAAAAVSTAAESAGATRSARGTLSPSREQRRVSGRSTPAREQRGDGADRGGAPRAGDDRDGAPGRGGSSGPAGSPGGTGQPGDRPAAREAGEPRNGGDGEAGGAETPAADSPVRPTDPVRRVKPALDGVQDTVDGVADGAGRAIDGAADGLNDTVRGVDNTVRGATDGVGQAVQGATGGDTDQVVQGVGNAVQGATEGVGETVQGVGNTVQGAGGGAGQAVQDATQGVGDTLEGVGGLLRPGG